jgi:hypothetical protein
VVENRNAYKVLVANGQGKRPPGRLKQDWRTLICMLNQLDGWMWTAFTWLHIRTNGVSSFEHRFHNMTGIF